MGRLAYGMNMAKAARAEAHVKKHGKTETIGRVTLLAFLAIALFIVSSFGFAYMRLQGNISQSDISDLLDGEQGPRDPRAGRAYNILVMGSDSRVGDSNIDGSLDDLGEDSMRSDTTMLVHISADRSHIEVVSIPRDTLVTIPSCKVRQSEDSTEIFRTELAIEQQFNWAFSTGGQTGDVASAAACTIKTTERLTGLDIDGYIVVNFAAFQDIVNALGGVPMYFEEDVYDTYSGLNVLAGCRLLDGQQALAFARARHNIGDGSGSDIGRIGRQQELVGSMLNEVLAMNLLTDSHSLYQVLDVGTQSLATSQGLGDLTTLVGLLYSLRSIDTANVHFITMPFTEAPQDLNRVVPTEDAELVWQAIKEDKPVWTAEDGSVVIYDSQNASPGASNSTTGSAEASPVPVENPSEPVETAPVCTKQNALRSNYD